MEAATTTSRSDPSFLNLVGFVTNSDSVIRLTNPTPAQLSSLSALFTLSAPEQLTLDQLRINPVSLAILPVLGSCIGCSETITSFSLEESSESPPQVSPEAAAAIVEMFVNALRAQNLRSVKISHVPLVSPMNETFAAALANSQSLVALSVCDCGLDTGKAAKFAEQLRGLLPQLESLGLCSNRLGSRCVKLFLGKGLRSLTLKSAGLDKEDGLDLGEALGKCSNLRKLELGKSFIRNRGATAMIKRLLRAGRAPELESVDLSCNYINSRILAQLFDRSSHLVSITISYNRLTDSPGVRIMRSLSACRFTLRELNAAGCRIGDKTVCALAATIGEANVLRSLNLWGNMIQDVGVKTISLQMLSRGSMVNLNVGNNRIALVGAKYLAMTLEDSTYGIQSLSVELNPIGRGAAILLDAISPRTCLEEIRVSGCGIGDAGAAALARLIGRAKRLRRVAATYDGFGLMGVKAISTAIADGGGIRELEMEESSAGEEVNMMIQEIKRRVRCAA